MAHDPVVRAERARAEIPDLELVSTPECAAEGADALVIATDWPEYAALSFDRIASLMAGTLVYDGRNLLDPGAVAAASLSYRGVGRVPLEPPAAPEASVGAAGQSRS